MTSASRAMSAIPNEELPILESLISIRNRLTALKKDSSDYIRPQDVQQLYQAVIKQVTRLNTVRDELAASEASTSNDGSRPSRPGAEPNGEVDTAALTATNRVDTTLMDVFSLLSLFFLTIGKSRETPATFSQLGCMKQLLDHLAESGIYTEADLQPFAKRLAELKAIVKRDADAGKHPPQLTKLMMRKLEGCGKVLRTLEGTLSVLSVELVPIHQRLVSVRRQIVAAAAKPKPARAEIKMLQEELRKIDSKRVDGKFLGPGGSSVPAGQAILVGILEDCFEIVHDANVRNDEVPMTLQPIYDRLSEIKSQLEHLVLTHRWTLRETDLWNYQVTLKEIDRLRVDGKFVDSEGKQPEGQLVLLYLLRRCYGLIYRLVASSEPISEELMPISNKLSTVSKCLKEVSKYGGPFTMRDLYPYRLALHQIDGMRSPVRDKDGKETGERKWLGRDGSVPEGQAILRAQYEEVEQTITEMLNREDDDDEDEDGDAVDEEEWEGSEVDSEVESVASSAAASGASPGLIDRSFPGSPAIEEGSGQQRTYELGATASPQHGSTKPMLNAAAVPSHIVRSSESELTPTATRFKGSVASGSSVASSDPTTAPTTVHSTFNDSPTRSNLPPGAVTVAVPGSVAPPAPGRTPVIPTLTARPGEPAVERILDGVPQSALHNSMTSSEVSSPAISSTGASLHSSPGQGPVAGSGKVEQVSSIDALAAHVAGDLKLGGQ